MNWITSPINAESYLQPKFQEGQNAYDSEPKC